MEPKIIVPIAFSAGGLMPLLVILEDFSLEGASFVILRHVPVYHQASLDLIIRQHSSLTVRIVEQGMQVQSGTIYVAPSDFYMTISRGNFQLVKRPVGALYNETISIFLKSAVEAHLQKIILVMLSGSGEDGVDCIPAINQLGGKVIVQDPATCEFGFLPRNAIGTGFVDYVAVPSDIPAILTALISKR